MDETSLKGKLIALQHQLSLLDSIPMGECVLQSDGTVLFWNVILEQWTNLPRSQVVGQKLDEVFPCFQQLVSMQQLQETFDHGVSLTFTEHLILHSPHSTTTPLPLQEIVVTPLPAAVAAFNALLSIKAAHPLPEPQSTTAPLVLSPVAPSSLASCTFDRTVDPTLDPCGQQTLHHQQERSVDRIVQRIRQSLNLKEILQTTVSEIQQFLQVDRALIYRLNVTDDSSRVIAEACSPHLPSLLGFTKDKIPLGHRYSEDPSLYWQQEQLQRVWAEPDITQSALDPNYVQFLRRFFVKARLCIPIFSTTLHSSSTTIGFFKSNLWGWLVAHDCQTPRQWTATEIQLLRYVESQLAVAIHQSELHQQVHHLNMNLERQVYVRTLELQQALNFEATLKRITDKVRDSLDEQQILRTVVNEVATALEVRYCDTSLYDAHSKVPMLQCSYAGTNPLPATSQQHLPIEQFPEIYTQLFQGHYVPFCKLSNAENAPRLAVLACPIVHEQEVLGDLWLFKPGASSFSELEVRLVEQVANQCAIAIRQAQLYKAAQARAEELAQLNRLKDDFLSTISHELRTPIASIQMALQTLELLFVRASKLNANCFNFEQTGLGEQKHSQPIENNHYYQTDQYQTDPYQTDSYQSRWVTPQNESDDGWVLEQGTFQQAQLQQGQFQQGQFQQIHEYFHLLEKECQREAKLIDDLLDLTRLDAGTEPLMLVPVQLQGWLPHIAEIFERQIAEHQQSLRFELPDHLPTLVTDLTILERIIIELLNNACKYTPMGGTITIAAAALDDRTTRICHCSTTQTLQIRVSNTGVEIPAAELPYVFDKFYRIPSNDPWRYGGTGLGLALVKRMAEYLGGCITVESQNNTTQFRLELAIDPPSHSPTPHSPSI